MICAMTGATLAAVDVFLAYISVVIFFLSVSLLLFCYWRYSGRVRRALMPRDGETDGRAGGRIRFVFRLERMQFQARGPSNVESARWVLNRV